MKSLTSSLFVLTDDTAAFDALDQVPLTEAVDNQQRKNNHQRRGVDNSGGIHPCRFKAGGIEHFRNGDNIGHQLGCGACKEHLCIEVIGPLPRESKEEHGDHHRNA